MRTQSSSTTVTVACLVLGITSLGYLVPLATAHPAPELLSAIALESIWFVAYIGYSIYRLKSIKGKAQQAVVSELISQVKVLKQGRKIWRRLLTVTVISAWLIMMCDLTAFLLAYTGHCAASAAIYRAVPVSTWLGLNVGASLEILGGAYVESAKYTEALPIYQEIEILRTAYYGADSDKIAALQADYGDLFVKMQKPKEAEIHYKLSIAMGNVARGNKGTGRAYTKLGILLANQGRYDEAAEHYETALAMRKEQFGANSPKVAETLFAYAVLLEQRGKLENSAADIALSRQYTANAQEILNASRKQGGETNLLPLIALPVSLVVSWLLFGRRGYLTNLVVKRLKARVERDQIKTEGDKTNPPQTNNGLAPAKSNRERDLKTLILLLQYQDQKDELARYKSTLTTISRALH